MAALTNPNHGKDLIASLTDLHGSGHFADVKLVCVDGALWSHRLLLAAVSPVLRHLLLECVNEDVVTLLMPHLRRTHLKLVLDYVYRGSMTLRARQMAHVIGVIEVLHLKCGVSVSKRKDSACDWVEEAEFDDFSDKAFNDLCQFKFYKSEPPPAVLSPKLDSPLFVGIGVSFPNLSGVGFSRPSERRAGVPPSEEAVNSKLNDDRFEEGEPVEVRPVHNDTESSFVTNETLIVKRKVVPNAESCSVVEVEPETDSDDAEELDDFVQECGTLKNENSVEKRPSSTAAINCVMCGKEFQYRANLRVHIQNHLGLKAQLKYCEKCDRNFRSATEYDLHKKSHEYAKLIGKCRNLTKYRKARAKAKVCRTKVRCSIRTLATVSNRGNLYRRYIWKVLRHQKMLRKKCLGNKRKDSEDKDTTLPPGIEEKPKTPNVGKVKLKIKVDPNKYKKSPVMESLTPSLLAPLVRPSSSCPTSARHGYRCLHCSKVFSIRSSFMRHSRVQHRVDTRSKEFLQSISKKRKVPPSSKAPPPPSKRPKPALSISPKKQKKPLKSNLHVTSPSHPDDGGGGGGQSPHPGSSGSKIRKSIEKELTCPTCDKAFLARSIFERHLKTYKHGRYEICEGASRTPSYIPEGGTNHMNLVLQPTIEVGGREVNKYECHLCHQVFLRVKDLAKHRQRMCTAWQN